MWMMPTKLSNQLIHYYNHSLLSPPFFGPGSATFESCDLGESFCSPGLMRGRDCYQVISTDSSCLFFIWWKETRFFFFPSHMAEWASLNDCRDAPPRAKWARWGKCRKKASEEDHPLNTKQHLNFSLNWRALYYGSAVGRCGGGGDLDGG